MQLLSEDECIRIGVTQGPGWMHYLVFQYEPFVLLFRRTLIIWIAINFVNGTFVWTPCVETSASWPQGYWTAYNTPGSAIQNKVGRIATTNPIKRTSKETFFL